MAHVSLISGSKQSALQVGGPVLGGPAEDLFLEGQSEGLVWPQEDDWIQVYTADKEQGQGVNTGLLRHCFVTSRLTTRKRKDVRGQSS